MKIFILLLLGFSIQARDYKLDKETFLKRIDENRISLDKAPIADLPQNMKPQILAAQKSEYPDFREEMWYVAYIDSNKYRYFVFYEWYHRGCIYGVTEPKLYKDKETEKNTKLALKEYRSYVSIKNKYCEKALGVSLPPGGLLRKSKIEKSN